MVLKQIQDLLHDHDCVIIPDFGGLIAQYASAKIHPVKHTFTPPSKKIAFNEKLKQNDGLLISNLAQHLHIPNQEAQQMVAEFVGNLQNNLSKNQRCELQGIGIFRYNAEHKLEFEYLEAENFSSNSFGLPDLTARPVVPAETATLRAVRQKTTPAPVPAGKKGFAAFTKKYTTVAGTVLLGGLTVALVYLVSLNTDYNLSSLNPVALFQSNSENAAQAEKTVAISPEKVTQAPAQTLDELPVTPEAQSVKAVEADYVASNNNTAAASAEPTTLKPMPTRSVNLGNRTTTSETTTEAKASEPASAIKTAVVKPEVKAETKTVAKIPEKVENKTVAKVTEKVAVKAETTAEASAISKNHTINAGTGRYFIISGGYATLANAERSKKELTAKGAESEIILPMKGSKLHRVSVAEFASMDQASAKLPELRKKYGNSLWILNY